MKKPALTILSSLLLFSTSAYTADVGAGKSLYAKCIGCHGMNGEGGVGPNLTRRGSADFIEKMHKYQKGEMVGPMTPMMAPSAKGLSEDDIKNLAAYVATLKK